MRRLKPLLIHHSSFRIHRLFSVERGPFEDAAGRRAAARYEELFAARGLRLLTVNLPSDVNDFFRQRPSAALEFQLMTERALETMNAE